MSEPPLYLFPIHKSPDFISGQTHTHTQICIDIFIGPLWSCLNVNRTPLVKVSLIRVVVVPQKDQLSSAGTTAGLGQVSQNRLG